MPISDVQTVQAGHHEIEAEERGVAVAAGDQIAVVADRTLPGNRPSSNLCEYSYALMHMKMPAQPTVIHR